MIFYQYYRSLNCYLSINLFDFLRQFSYRFSLIWLMQYRWKLVWKKRGTLKSFNKYKIFQEQQQHNQKTKSPQYTQSLTSQFERASIWKKKYITFWIIVSKFNTLYSTQNIAKRSDSGTYVCVLKENLRFLYFHDVITDNKKNSKSLGFCHTFECWNENFCLLNPSSFLCQTSIEQNMNFREFESKI